MMGLALLTTAAAAQTTFHVSTNGAHSAPFDTWANAATTVQAAVALATNMNDVVLVSNGVYVLSGAEISVTNGINVLRNACR